ncbi:hypothetical protein CMO83_03880 [Candidatus Woesearchaeota archaeon]|jgi:hypothetical protein|nr:hypothetical protein [Candidatus Woesearchaeota archaeon]MAG91789.1 hypothetical protein [Candidatus Woesearchaeota archaeon]|tara:strand:+ start:23982 stop:24326 length:345 start_codon:yes stop_codon:yes gene_type:complete
MNKKIIYLLFFLSVLIISSCDTQVIDDTPAPEPKCGIENCHGLDIKCGSNVPDFCTEIYKLGDKCRQFANCETIDGSCQFVSNEQFEECKSCVDNCVAQYEDDANKAFECESNC